jgi:AP-4 complex subunit mu-1
LPKDTASCTFEIPRGIQGQTAEHKLKDNVGEWIIRKFKGGDEHTILCKITLKGQNAAQARKEIGPVILNFEIPMFNVSKL